MSRKLLKHQVYSKSMIKEEDIAYIRKRLQESAKTLIFFDDDPDGVASYLLIYKLCIDAKGICVKGKPVLEKKYARKVEEYVPDLVLILDKPLVEQEFIDSVTQEIIWIDHHPLQDNKRVKYFNPRKIDPEDNRPTSYWAYQVAKNNIKNPLWIAAIGTIGDWSDCLNEELKKEYPDLLPDNIKTPPQALFGSELGKLSKIVDFNLKGTTTQVMQSIKILTRIESPEEILKQTTPRGKYIYKKYATINEKYESIKKSVKKDKTKFIVFRYQENKLAISSMLSNELLYEHPDKIIIIIREKEEEAILSLRSATDPIVEKLQVALQEVNGKGGGHDFACGASMKKEELDRFLDIFKKQFKKQ